MVGKRGVLEPFTGLRYYYGGTDWFTSCCFLFREAFQLQFLWLQKTVGIYVINVTKFQLTMLYMRGSGIYIVRFMIFSMTVYSAPRRSCGGGGYGSPLLGRVAGVGGWLHRSPLERNRRALRQDSQLQSSVSEDTLSNVCFCLTVAQTVLQIV